ncbi:lysoplasmalogenase [Sphingomonas sp. SUN039]|uniref:lysoplasmalogenase n=1 Tax=Sphingomonas sp. SUN039 TaxID=2937787 RepID=UPI0021647D0F|nr:lysoplasmalogenase [Sphingomonas sp. SUN039]UVO53230.1 lysoplasmalogenase [Sphingomonas sp. SUN039]
MGNERVLRRIFAAALVAGTSYLLAGPLGVAGPVAIAWKGAGVALLALWCALQARDRDGWLIAAVMAFGALGDVLLEAVGLTAGAFAFLFGHLIAAHLYGRNQRPVWTRTQRALAVTLALATPLIAWVLTYRIDIVPYAFWLGIMAATAWVSRFPRYRVGLGAVMFVASDLLIFAKLGPLAGSPVPGLLIWPLYFGGQVLIARGITQTLAQDRR